MDAISIASTALNAQSVNMSVIAGNIANAATPDYAPKQATLLPMSPGVAVGPIIASPEASDDVSSDLVSMMFAAQAYAAATKVVSISDQMSQDLLNAV
jgi:flagellar hook protein FlgE